MHTSLMEPSSTEPGLVRLPRLSVVIPTCRRNDSLAKCLDKLSKGAQTIPFDTYEVIVADDGSGAENARALVQTHYPWVRWFEGPRRGPAANRNLGAAAARGAWLVFTDDDCLPQPDWLAAYLARIDAPSGAAVRVLEGLTRAGQSLDYGPFMTAPLNDTGGFLWSCNFAIECKLFGELGGFDAQFPYPHLEDVDLRMRLEDQGEKWPFVPEAVVEHPPRAVGSLLKWVKSQESAFYLARKRGIPVSQVGQSVMTYLRIWVQTLRKCRNAREVVVSSVRLAAAAFLVACHAPFWMMKYRG